MPTPWSQERYIEAWNFASQAHEGQYYNSPQPNQRYPYINHIGRVAMELIWALPHHPDIDADLAIECALLHDVLEDTPVDYPQLEQHFSQAVAIGVSALSKNDSIEDKVEKMRDSLERIQQQPQEIWMVKLADRISNMSPPPAHWPPEKCSSYREEARMILDYLGPASPSLAARLSEKIDDYHVYCQN